jgi:pentatricopeptide repeat protein
MESDGARIQENLRDLFAFLSRDGAKHGIDGERIGIYAASANVTQTSRFLFQDGAASNVKAAVLYYGGEPAGNAKLRADLPVLFILAESDAPQFAPGVTPLWQRVMEAKAPWTLMYASRMPHAFDAFEDSDESRRIIQQTIAFWKSHLETVPQPGWKPSPARAIVAALYGNNPQKSTELLQKYIAENPNDGDAYNHYGRMLAQLRRFEEAGAAYEKALALGVSHGGVYNGLGQTRVAQKRWDEAVQYLTKAVELGARNSMVYGQLAYAQLALNRNEDAIKTYEKAFEAGIPPGANTRGAAYYNMASGYARLKQSDKAFEMLNKAVDEGFSNRQTMETDTDLAALRTDERFQNLLKRLAAPTN